MAARIAKKKIFIILAGLAAVTLLTAFFTAPAIAKTRAASDIADEALIVMDDRAGERWSRLTCLNIFSNPDYGGGKLVAPMDGGTYEFTVQNNARFPFTYRMDITDENVDGIPMQFRLRDETGKYLVGDADEWSDIVALSDIQGNLEQQASTRYTLEWRWPGDNDPLDTSIGIKAAAGNVQYILNFNITAVQSGPAVMARSPGTGDDASAAVWIGAAALLTSGALVFLGRRARRVNETD